MNTLIVYFSATGTTARAAKKLAETNPDKTIVVLLPDTGERYLSTLNLES